MDVLHSIDGHVATVTLSNPGRYNAMSLAMWVKLADTLDQLDANASVRAVVLRGEGGKAFVSGADISEFGAQRSGAAAVAAYDEAVARAQGTLTAFRCPVIAAVSGICYGGGLGLILACDLRYGSPGAKFRMPAARLGLGYGFTGIKRMVDVLGVSRAAELFYTAKVCDAGEALALGLLGSVQEHVFAYAAQTAEAIAANAPLTLRAAKLAMGAVLSGDDALRPGVDAAVQACFESADYVEGRAAFAEKRPPRFTGR
ncbi:MAG: carnitinyl-CoA dehydratase [Polaromonas sp.]|nr:carnitinyl-CoA dehydratase [Polaromonas sp.]